MKGIDRGAAEEWRASAAHVVSERERQLPEAVEQAERVLMLLEAGDRFDDRQAEDAEADRMMDRELAALAEAVRIFAGVDAIIRERIWYYLGRRWSFGRER